MSRNKENNPLFTTQRLVPVTSLSNNPPSEDFFTDSIIDGSLIPSPSPHKAKSVNPRRAIGTSKALRVTKDSGNRSQRSSLSEYTASRSGRHLQPAPTLTRRKSPSPLRTDGPKTPPHSRHEPNLTTPTSEFSSPPGGLTDVYQRIADEEDLAATERDFDTDEEDIQHDPPDTQDIDMDVNPTDEPGDRLPENENRISRESTPVQSANVSEKDLTDDRGGSLSEPATLDFVRNEMTDRILAAKLTPHVVDRVKDRSRLEKLQQSQIPIDFKNGSKAPGKSVSENFRRNDLAGVANRGPIIFADAADSRTNGASKAYSDTSGDATPQKRAKAFSRASRNRATENVPHNEVDNGSVTPPGLREKERMVAFSKATRRANQDLDEPASQIPIPGPKLVAFSRANGGPRLPASPDGPAEHAHGTGQSTESVASAESEPLPGASQPALTFLAKWRQKTAEQRAVKAQEIDNENTSQLDWAAAAADVPLPSIEESSTPRNTPPHGAWPSSIQKQRSMERVNRWENDFTGFSFQVSESPPVRSRPNPNDSLREKEIESLAKQAVTTNRLDKIREKNPNGLVRKSSRSFSPEERRQNGLELVGGSNSPKIDTFGAGELVPDTPVVVYRSSSNSTEKAEASQRPTPESQRSLDHLQRLARATSTTPKPSPVSLKSNQETMVVPVAEGNAVDQTPNPHQAREKGEAQSSAGKVMETPKVVGAWTDTILPDTARTEKSFQRKPSHLETPHINAGAWIETPLAGGNRIYSIPVPTTIEEVTEELTNIAIPAETEPMAEAQAEEDSSVEVLAKKEDEESKSPEEHLLWPQSALTNVLNEAKQKRLVSRDMTDDRDDSLNLGDATIQSFEDLLTDAADITADLTSLIHASAEDEVMKQRQLAREELGDSTTAEVAFIGHLTSRMERLMSNLHEARQGISRLEQKVSHAPSPSKQIQLQTLLAMQSSTQPCAVCGKVNDPQLHRHDMDTQSFFPISYSTFTLPIPLLFYPRRKDQGQILPRPTWLGWVTILLWSWYIAECTMCELYARPLYAERYIWPAQPEPEFPFVLPTMLWRWSHFDTLAPGLLGTVWRLVVAVYRVIGMALGLIDGFVDDARSNRGTPAGLAEATRSVLNMATSLMPGDDLSMMNDELM